MQISYLRDLLEASVLCGEDRLEEDVSTVFASDMMSDVLACPDEIQCLLTGLMNSQVIRTADMMDIGLIVFVRGKCPPEDVVETETDDKAEMPTSMDGPGSRVRKRRNQKGN